MALALMLGQAGFTPRQIHARAAVEIEHKGGGYSITRIHLETDAAVPELTERKFQELAEAAKRDCPVSRALAGTSITLSARLVDR